MVIPCRQAIRAIVLVALVAVSVRSAETEDAVWNLRTPEWKETFAAMPDGETARLEFIRVASQLAAYSGFFYPVTPIVLSAGLPPGHVPVDTAWFTDEPSDLIFPLARGWGHLVLEHETVAEAGTPEDAALWLAGGRYDPADETRADAWAGRFLAEMGYDAIPVVAALCTQARGPERAAAIAEAHEEVLGWAPEVPCVAGEAAPTIVVLGSCSEQFEQCRATVEGDASACHRTCRAVDCALACSGGSYDQCNSCMESCGRSCNGQGGAAYDLCLESLDLCETDEG